MYKVLELNDELKHLVIVIKIGIIGAGVIGTRLSNRFDKETNIKISWICDIDVRKAKILADQFNTKAITDYLEGLADVDAIYLGVPPKWHHDIAIKVLEAGKHLVCEKPLAMNDQQTNNMVTVAEKSGKITTVNFPFRWTPGVIEFKNQLANGYLGEIKKIIMRFRFPYWPRKWQDVDWLYKKEQGGPLREVGSHFFFALKEFEPWIGKVIRVMADVEYGDDGKCEYTAHGWFELDSGLKCVFDLLTDVKEKEENSITVVGSKGKLTLQNWYRLLGCTNLEEEWEVLNEEYGNSEDMVSAFVKNLENKKSDQLLVSFKDAAYAQKILNAIYSSNGTWINC